MGWASRQPRRLTPLFERSGLVAVVSGDRTTYPQFSVAICAALGATPGANFSWTMAGGGGVAMARNRMVREALRNQNVGWVWFIDDDHAFEPDLLIRLLKHDRDITVPLVAMKSPPHRLVAWELFDVPNTTSDADLALLTTRHGVRHVSYSSGTGLIELGMAGTGGMLVSREVFESLADPWFEFGRFGSDSRGEDMWFSLKARRAGFRIFCDRDTPMGHLTTCAVWPAWNAAKGAIAIQYRFGFVKR